MMGFPTSSPDTSTIQSQQQEEQEGKDLLDKLNSKTITCQSLTDTDFEKIGEYFMGKSIGDTSRHIGMNNMMKSMMGEQGEAQMHAAWGKRSSGCDSTASFVGTMGGGGPFIMGYGGMMNGNIDWMTGFGFFGLVIRFLVMVILILLAVFLWKQIQRRK